MTPHDTSEFAQLMAILAHNYAYEMDNEKLEIYWVALKPFTLLEVHEAVRRCITSVDDKGFMPKPGELIRTIQGSSATQALQAWTKVDTAIRGIGTYTTVVFDDPIIHCVIEDLGGWIRLCAYSTQALEFKQKDFQQRYVGYMQAKPRCHLRKLIGLNEHINTSNGYEQEFKYQMIGDKEAAEVVYQTGMENKHSIAFHSVTTTFLEQVKLLDKEGVEK